MCSILIPGWWQLSVQRFHCNSIVFREALVIFTLVCEAGIVYTAPMTISPGVYIQSGRLKVLKESNPLPYVVF